MINTLFLISTFFGSIDYTFNGPMDEIFFLLIEEENLIAYNDIDNSNLLFFNLKSGAFEKNISIPSGFWISNYTFFPDRYFVLNTLRRAEKGGLEKRILFYGLDGQALGYGQDSNLSPEDPLNIYYRQIIDVDGRVYVNKWERRNSLANDARILQEVEIKKEGSDIFDFSYIGPPLKKDFDEATAIVANFRAKWVIHNKISEVSEKLFIIEELDTKLWIYSSKPSLQTTFELDGFRQLQLKGWVSPDQQKEKEEGFYTSFSRVVGASKGPSGILVASRNPLTGKNVGRDRIRSPLRTQLFSFTGESLGAGHEYSESIFLGVLSSGVQITLRRKGNVLSIERESLGSLR